MHTTDDMSESFDLSIMTMKAEPSFHLISTEDEEMSDVDVKPMVLVSESPPPFPEHVNHFLTIQKNLKEERDDLECEVDPLLVLNPDDDEDVSSTKTVDPSLRVTHELDTGDNPIPSNPEKSYRCEVCGECFKIVCDLTRHKLTHTGEKPHKCNFCGKCFSRYSNLTRHKLTHTGERPHKCDTCGKNFAHLRTLTNHTLIHTGERPHKCDVCGKCFIQRYLLSNHKLTHKVLECDVCGQQFRRSSILTTHKMTKHTTKEKSGSQNDNAGASGQTIAPWGFPRLLRRP